MSTESNERIDLGDGMRFTVTESSEPITRSEFVERYTCGAISERETLRGLYPELVEQYNRANDVSHLPEPGASRDKWYGTSD